MEISLVGVEISLPCRFVHCGFNHQANNHSSLFNLECFLSVYNLGYYQNQYLFSDRRVCKHYY